MKFIEFLVATGFCTEEEALTHAWAKKEVFRLYCDEPNTLQVEELDVTAIAEQILDGLEFYEGVVDYDADKQLEAAIHQWCVDMSAEARFWILKGLKTEELEHLINIGFTPYQISCVRDAKIIDKERPGAYEKIRPFIEDGRYTSEQLAEILYCIKFDLPIDFITPDYDEFQINAISEALSKGVDLSYISPNGTVPDSSMSADLIYRYRQASHHKVPLKLASEYIFPEMKENLCAIITNLIVYNMNLKRECEEISEEQIKQFISLATCYKDTISQTMLREVTTKIRKHQPFPLKALVEKMSVEPNNINIAIELCSFYDTEEEQLAAIERLNNTKASQLIDEIIDKYPAEVRTRKGNEAQNSVRHFYAGDKSLALVADAAQRFMDTAQDSYENARYLQEIEYTEMCVTRMLLEENNFLQYSDRIGTDAHTLSGLLNLYTNALQVHALLHAVPMDPPEESCAGVEQEEIPSFLEENKDTKNKEDWEEELPF